MSELSADTPEDVIELAKFLHDEYERAAMLELWDTQEGTSVSFLELLEENQRTMIRLALSLLQWYDIRRSGFHEMIDELIEE